jgi:hypothetical protein
MIAGMKGKIARLLPQPVLQSAFDVIEGRTAVQRAMADRIDRARTHSARTGLEPGYVPARTAGGTVLARTVRRFSAAAAAQENAALAAAAAESAGVEYRLEPGRPGGGRRLVAAADDLPRIARELRHVAEKRPVYAGASGGALPVLFRTGRTDSFPLDVFEYRCADGLVLAGSELACRICPAGDALPPAAIDDVTDPVDIVYTWVDGDDPRWAREREAAWARIHPGTVNPHAANEERYRSHDELRYSLRSVDYYAPWANRIFLVTAGQVPHWLDTGNPRITVVDHREIFPADALPTFNSHAIEARLHLVPGLSEQFLYLNDDVFFGRRVGPERFFHGNGLAKFFLSEQRIPDGGISQADLPVDSAAKRNRRLLEERFGRTVSHKFKHAAHAERVSTLLRLEQDFPADHARTTRSRFRSPSDISIPSSLAHYYGYGIGAAVPGTIAYRFCDISEPSAPAKLLRLLRDRDADVFCLNETGPAGVAPERRDALLKDFLEAYFPVPGSFELGEE